MRTVPFYCPSYCTVSTRQLIWRCHCSTVRTVFSPLFPPPLLVGMESALSSPSHKCLAHLVRAVEYACILLKRPFLIHSCLFFCDHTAVYCSKTGYYEKIKGQQSKHSRRAWQKLAAIPRLCTVLLTTFRAATQRRNHPPPPPAYAMSR